jgi:hypothetical protein
MRAADQKGQRVRSNRKKSRPPFDLSVFKISDSDGDARRKRATRQRKVTSQNEPPVMARLYNAEIPYQPRHNKPGVRRRYDVPLKSAGAEIRLPSLPVVRLGARWISLLLLVTLAGMAYFLWNSPTFQVSEAKIIGAKKVKSSDINAAMDIAGRPVFALNQAELEEKLLQKFPEFSAVRVKVALPDEVTINVKERAPVMTWHMGNQTFLVDASGMAFPLRLASTQVVLPVVEASGLPPAAEWSMIDPTALVINELKEQVKAGEKDMGEQAVTAPPQYKAQQLLTADMVAAVLAIAKIAPADRPLLFDPGHGFGWTDQRGWQVFVGNDQDVPLKLRVYDAIVQRLLQDGVQPTLISVEYVHNPYVRVENE